MERRVDLGDLSLLVRALHNDVSTLDERLRRLEGVVRELRASVAPGEDPKLVVLPSRESRTLGA
jgi:tetrahydromethanopterin S-methyltransferase subunit B